jgi:hypothetical protein
MILVISKLPVSLQTAKILVKILLRLEKKINEWSRRFRRNSRRFYGRYNGYEIVEEFYNTAKRKLDLI